MSNSKSWINSSGTTDSCAVNQAVALVTITTITLTCPMSLPSPIIGQLKPSMLNRLSKLYNNLKSGVNKLKNLNYYLNQKYPIKLKQLPEEDGGGWFAEIPLLPGCMSDGETVEEAIANLNDARKGWIETSLSLGRSIPEPLSDDFSGQLRVRMPKSLHRALTEKAKEENVSLNQLIIYHLARGIGRNI